MFRLVATRAVAVLVLVVALSAAAAGTAIAHGGGGIEPESHVPRVVALDPPVPGLTVEVIEAGERLRIDNRTAVEVSVAPPTGATRTVEPIVSPTQTARWTDLRVVAAAADPRPAEGARSWVVPLLIGDRTVLVRGEQVWPPPPVAGLWWLATAVVAVGVAVVGSLAVHRRRLAPVLAGVTVLVAGAHVVHVVGSALVVEGRPLFDVVLGAAGVTVAAWVLAVVGVALTLGGRSYGPLLCALSGAMLALFTAFDVVGFSSAVLPFAGPADLDRATTVLTFGGGLGLFLVGFTALGRLTSPAPFELQR